MKVNDLQKLLSSKNLDGFIFSTTDEYLNEYVPDYNNRLQYITNFSGSFGVLVVLQNDACLFTDSRYTLAAKEQVDLAIIEVELFSEENIYNWIKNKSSGKNLNIALNSKVTSINFLKFFESLLKKIKCTAKIIDYHLVDEIWENRPEAPKTSVYLHDEEYGSLNYKEKIKTISKKLQEKNIDAFLVTALDNIAWLLNIRGNDIPCNPLSLSKLIIKANGDVYWFIDEQKTKSVKDYLSEINFYKEKDLELFLKNLDVKIIGLSNNSPIYYLNILQEINFNVELMDDIITIEKAQKNDVEIASIKKAHMRDGAYLVKLYCDIYKNPSKYNEVSIDKKLTEIKSHDPLYLGSSFPSIVGINSNGAIVHYRANEKTSKALSNDSYLLLDCGSQYLDGTTDITRTFSFNSASEDFKKHYTLVLKGHIAVASLIFKDGTTGSAVDLLARKPLWEYGLDYGHGTGHGIGFFLCVHEGPQSISPNNNVPLKEGMIISNEPGYYVEGKYGIRLENLYAVAKSKHEGFLCFENLTFAPFDIKNINFDMLSKDETKWLENYHNEVYAKLLPLLMNDEKDWLKNFIHKTL
jgi:Xaa-Pro aminopeptidase